MQSTRHLRIDLHQFSVKLLVAVVARFRVEFQPLRRRRSIILVLVAPPSVLYVISIVRSIPNRNGRGRVG